MAEKLPAVDKEATGENIKRLMRKVKIDTYELANVFGVRSTTSIYAWTQGKILPSADSLVKLAHIFNCTVDEILVVSEDGEDEISSRK